jgi:hypothetical protein
MRFHEWFKGKEFKNGKAEFTVDGMDSTMKRLKVMKPAIYE